MRLRIKSSLRYCSIICVLQWYTVEKIRLLKSVNNVNLLIPEYNHPEHRHQQRSLNYNMCQKKIPVQNKGGFWAADNYLDLDRSSSCMEVYFVKIHGALRL